MKTALRKAQSGLFETITTKEDAIIMWRRKTQMEDESFEGTKV